MNYKLLRQRVCQTVGIPIDDPNDEEYQLVGDLLNEGVRDILSRTRLHVRCVHMHLIDGKDDYEIDDNILRMITLKIGNTFLEQRPRKQLDQWSYAVPGHDLIVFGFLPGSGMQAEAWYVPRPTEMTDDNDDPADMEHGNVEQQFQPALINYTLWHIADTLDDTSSSSGERYRVLYEGQDGNAGVGTNLGMIKRAVNRRAMSGSRARPHGDGALIDSDPYLWVG